MRPLPAAAVIGWFEQQQASQLFTTSITLAEIRYGIERLPAGQRKDLLRDLAVETFSAFPDQVIPFDAPAALAYAVLVADREKSGAPISGFDAQIAAICRTRG